MSDKLFQEKLSLFKENEKPEVVLLITNDQDAIKLLIAWTNTYIKQKRKYSNLSSDNEIEIWHWLWCNTIFSMDEVKIKSGLSSVVNIERKLNFLIGNKVIYPDGTLNSFIQRYLREKVINSFESKNAKTNPRKK